MSSTRLSSTVDGGSPLDASPLLSGSGGGRRGFGRRPSLRGPSRFFRQVGSRRMMREPSMLVRETAAEHLEERQSDWAYSKPVVVLDTLWNLAFVAVAVGVLVSSREESPSKPLRLWIGGYAFQCVLHLVCVCVEYRRRNYFPASREEGGSGRRQGSSAQSSSWEVQTGVVGAELNHDEEKTSIMKHLESANTMFSFIWWIIGFYWLSAGGPALTRDAPQLYWLCIVFLAFDVFITVFCVALACVVGLAVCCCLPCIIAILYAVTDQEGASDVDIHQLSKFKFQKNSDPEELTGELQRTYGGVIMDCGSDSPILRNLSAEDAECCICLSAYDDGAELRVLPCNHHFHCTCIDRWLYINFTCPLCKSNVGKGNNNRREEV